MTIHDLKSWPEFYEAVSTGLKTFELRQNDRGYRVGDVLRLREWDPGPSFSRDGGAFTGRECRRRVVYILEGVGVGCIQPLKGILRGYCILGLAMDH